MKFRFKYKEYHPTPLMRGIQIFLLILILIGVALIVTQDLWVPSLVDFILKYSY